MMLKPEREISMNENRFYIRQYPVDSFYHGGIGYRDAEEVFKRQNFIPIAFPFYDTFSLVAKVSRIFYLLGILLETRKRSCIIFLFPVFARMNRLLIRLSVSGKTRRLICFIADVDGIKDGNQKLLKKEIAELKRYRYFIVHNDSMAQWLRSHVPEANIATIEFFDFLTYPFLGNRTKDGQIVFAGNLEKSKFLESLGLLKEKSPGLHFNLYGPGITAVMQSQDNVTYHGVMKPYELPLKLNGSFGLVWDGDSIEGPGGSRGDYMKYISHHKLSLYIVSGLPLIVPEMAASAPLVRKYGIGITVGNLAEIEQKINDISPEWYQEMIQNMKPLAKKICNGDCIAEALNQLIK